ncbi:L,D-transpeptidase family protein [Paenibacillus macerans]|uniref:L,D-transpeptidase family protein n=1 Tax=Paenibacillus macerans TaxID=44252 RepID=A0A6N8EYE1_PAEMA|nr:L,D-transpeptidase family protein [Paenibacillus macerans]MUG24685.1 L,D-transpeptidase family protein [Paenibacillus macerans]
MKNKTLFIRAAILTWLLGFTGACHAGPAGADPALPIIKEEGIYSLEIYPREHRLIVKIQGHKYKTYPVAVGNPSTPTPVGEYLVTYKGKNWGPAFGPRWLGLNVPWGYYGIHGTNRPDSIGRHLSHGCIRMRNRDVLELYDLVPVGTKVTIYGHLLGDISENPRDLAESDVGGDVQLIQSRLKSAGYFQGVCNGRFRADTTAALKRFQRDHRLIQNGVVSKKVYEALGLWE